MKSNILKIVLPLGFFIFISAIIFIADNANYNFALRWVGAIPYGDKLGHATLYGVMAMLLNYGLSYRKIKGLQLGAVLVLTFAIIEEFSQIYIPSRTFDLYDILADIVGVLLFSLLTSVIKKENRCSK